MCVLGKHFTIEPSILYIQKFGITSSSGNGEEDGLVRERISNIGGFREVCSGS